MSGQPANHSGLDIPPLIHLPKPYTFGSLIGLVLLTRFLLSTGLLTLVARGAVAYAANQSKA